MQNVSAWQCNGYDKVEMFGLDGVDLLLPLDVILHIMKCIYFFLTWENIKHVNHFCCIF